MLSPLAYTAAESDRPRPTRGFGDRCGRDQVKGIPCNSHMGNVVVTPTGTAGAIDATIGNDTGNT